MVERGGDDKDNLWGKRLSVPTLQTKFVAMFFYTLFRQFLPVLKKQFKSQAKFHAKTFTIYSHFVLNRLNLQPQQTVISAAIIKNNIVLETIKKN